MSREKNYISNNTLSNIEIFNKKIVAQKFARADRNDFLIAHARQILDDKLTDFKRTFSSVLEITRNDEVLTYPPNTFDSAISSLHLHFINDVPGLLVQIKNSLKDDGLFIANFFGGECLKELKTCFAEADPDSISPRVSPFMEVRDAGNLLLRAGFALPVTDSEKLEVSYENAFHLMHHLRKIGETNSLIKQRKNFTTRNFMNRVNEIYAEKFSDDEGRIIATYEIITMVGWKPHASQQKPLRRGSGEVNLNDIL